MEAEVNNITQLGYPGYSLTILGIQKILGVAAVLIPKFPLLKEWAYFSLPCRAQHFHVLPLGSVNEIISLFVIANSDGNIVVFQAHG